MAFKDEEDAVARLGLNPDPEDALATSLGLKPAEAPEPLRGPVGPSGGVIRPNTLEGTEVMAREAARARERAFQAQVAEAEAAAKDPRTWSLDQTRAHFKDLRKTQGALTPEQEILEKQLVDTKKAELEAPERAVAESLKLQEKEARTGFIDRFQKDFKAAAKKLATINPVFGPYALAFEAGMATAKTKPMKAFQKGAANQVASMPQIVGGLIKDFGENMETKPDFWKASFDVNPAFSLVREFNRFAQSEIAARTDVDERIAAMGEKLRRDNVAYIKANPELYRKNGDAWESLFYDLGGGAASVAESLGLAAIGTPAASAAFFGLYQKGSIYNEARERGLSPEEADRVSSAAGVVEGGLEMVGVSKFLKYLNLSKLGARFANRAKAVITEAVQEGLQQAGEEALTQKRAGITKMRDDTFNEIAGRIGYSFVLGGLVAAPASVLMTAASDLGLDEELKRQGVPGQDREEVKNRVMSAFKEEAATVIGETLPKAQEGVTGTEAENQVLRDIKIEGLESLAGEVERQPRTPPAAAEISIPRSSSSKGEIGSETSLRTPPTTSLTSKSEGVTSTEKTRSSKRSSFLSRFSMVQPSEGELTRFYDEIQGNLEPFESGLKAISEAVGAEGWTYRVKRTSSLNRKVARKNVSGKVRPIGTINDMIAGSLFVPKGTADAAIAAMTEKFPDMELTTDFRKAPTFLGYKGIHYDMHLPNGQLGEVQLFEGIEGLQQKIYAHDIYDKWRDFFETNDGTPENLNKVIDKIKAAGKVKDFYEAVELSKRIYSGQEPIPPEIVQKTREAVESRGDELFTAGPYAVAQKKAEVFRGSEGVKRTVLESALAKTKDQGGITIDPRTGEEVVAGYAFSEAKANEKIIDLNTATVDDLLAYVEAHKDEWVGGENKLGLWVEDDVSLYLDTSKVVADKGEAVTRAAAADQAAVYDLNKKEVISIRGARRENIDRGSGSERSQADDTGQPRKGPAEGEDRGQGTARLTGEEPGTAERARTEEEVKVLGYMPIGGGALSLPENANLKSQLAVAIVRGDPVDASDLTAYPDLSRIKRQLDTIRSKTKDKLAQKLPVPLELVKAGEKLIRELGYDPAFLKKNAPSAARITGQPKPKETVVREDQALRASLTAQERAAKYGYRAGVAEERARLLEALRQKREDIAGIKQEVFDYARTNLPPAARGKLLSNVRDAETATDLAKAFVRVDKEVEALQRRGLVGEIKKRLAKIKDSQTIAVDYKPRVQALIDGIDLTRRQEQTMNRLEATRDYIRRERAAGRDPVMPQHLLDALDILDKKPLDTVTVPELEAIIDRIEILEQLGETKLRSRRNLIEAEKIRIFKEIEANVRRHPIEKIEEDLPPVGVKPTVSQKFRNAFIKKLNFSSLMDLSITPMDAVFDLMDGSQGYTGPMFKNFKKREDLNYSRYLDRSAKKSDEIWVLADELGLNEQNFERIGVYAAAVQETGIEKLMNAGLTMDEIQGVKLSADELKLYDKMRENLDTLRPEIEKMMREVYNESLGKVENYFSFLTDFKAMSEAEVFQRIGERADFIGDPGRKNPELGFTKARVGAGKHKIKLNAMEVYTQHIDNAIYALEIGPDNKMLFELANTDGMKELLGDRGQAIALEWVDLMSRKGGAAGDARITGIDTLRKNIGSAVLGFKLTSALIQPTALLDGAALIGKYAFSGAHDVATSKDLRIFLKDNFPELRARIADDPGYIEFSDNKTLAEIQQAGFWALQKLDGITAASITAGAYQKYLDEHGQKLDFENPDPEAVAYAQLILRRTQASPQFKDLPLILSRGKFGEQTRNRSLARLVFQFQTFMLNRWSLIRHDLARIGIQNGDYARAGNIAFYLALANLAEMGIRRMSKEMIEALTDHEEPDEDDSFWKQFAFTVTGNVPFVSQGVSMAAYGGIPVPALSVLDRIFGKTQSRLIKGKRPETKIKGLVNLAEFAATLLGVPGARQFGDIAEDLVDEKL